MARLTKRIIDAATLQPGEGERFIWDDELPGFGLRLLPSGRKSYVVQYKAGGRGGKTRRQSLGLHGPMTPEQARTAARRILGQRAQGTDPIAEGRERRPETVAALCDQYLEAARAGLVMTRFRRPKRPATIAIDEGRVARHIVPLIGAIRARDLRRAAVQRMVDDIAAGKTAGVFKGKPRGRAVVSGGSGTAARVVELLGGIWSWAERRDLVSGPSPTHGVERARSAAKDRVLSGNELRALGRVLDAAEAGQPRAVAAVRLIALTGLRRDEACTLRWGEVDPAGCCLRLEATKTGASTRPIGKAARDLLATLPREGEWLFLNRSGTGPADLKAAIAGLFNSARLRDARSHDLRRTFASIAADEGYSDATIAELLGHARRGVTARHYIRRPDAALVAAADRTAARIVAAMSRSEGTGGEVVPLSRSA